MHCCNKQLFCATALLLTLLTPGAWAVPTIATTTAGKPTFHAGPEAARAAAAADQSVVLLVFSAKWCGICRQLKAEVLASREFVEKGGAVRVVEVDVDDDEKQARLLKVVSVPTLVLVTADDKIIARHTGGLDVETLLAWIEAGRRRARQGEWEGIAPSGQLEEFAAKAAADRLETNDLKRLVGLLAQADPGERAGVSKILLQQREAAVPYLIAAVGDAYLGARIGAAELLQKLAGDELRKVVGGDLVTEVWAGAGRSREMAGALRQWWEAAGKLPSPAPEQNVPLDTTTEGSIRVALELLRGNDPVARTDAMSTLVAHGTAALPSVREALKRNDRAGDPRGVGWLEDVRWAILVPDTVERRAGRVRQTLAHGNSTERQAAAGRLGKAGKAAIPALAELADDADPLVVESAVRALSSIGGKDAVPAMTALLRAGDSNLRMTAAQALGHTRSQDAVGSLLAAFEDPNEVVACAAIAAVEEVRSARSYSAKPDQPADLVVALQRALADPRWRVRAVAAEVAGKLKVGDTTETLKKLLDDPDGFVVKNALQALENIGAVPDADQLAKLARRLTALRGEAVELMLKSESTNTVKMVTQLYEASGPTERAAILNTFLKKRGHESWESVATQWSEMQKRGASSAENEKEAKPADVWQPLLARAVKDPEAVVRRAAAAAVGTRPPPTMAELVGNLLPDPDRDAQATAAGLVIGLVSSDWGTTNGTFLTPAMVSGWHEALRRELANRPPVNVAVAAYVTGDGTAELSALSSALGRLDEKTVKKLQETPAVAALVKKLPWPAGRAVVDAICGVPSLYAVALTVAGRRPGGVADYLLEPARLRTVFERADKSDHALLVKALINSERGSWSLADSSERTARVREALLGASNSVWRAAAVYALGRQEAEKSMPVVLLALTDASPTVRVAAVQSVSRLAKERAVLEPRLGSLVGDADRRVASVAAWALLEPEIREAAGLNWEYRAFRVGETSATFNESSESRDERPLATLEGTPPFLTAARTNLTATNTEERAVFALLLAQYGDFSGVDLLIAAPVEEEGKNRSLPAATLAGIELRRDAKYLPYLRQLLAVTKEEYELRRILRAAKGMSGPEVRTLRVEINKKMRQKAD